MFVVSCCKPLLPLLSCVFVLSFVKSVFAVGSEAVAVFDIIFKKFIDCRGCFRGWLIGLLFLVVLGWMIDCCYCISWQILWLIDMIVYCGWLYVVVVCRDCLGDWFYDWWDSLSCLFWRFVWACFWLRDCVGCLLQLFDVICFGFLLNGCDFVRKKKNKGLTVHCNVAVVKPCVKWVRSDLNGWSFDLGVYCLLWKRFLVLNVVLRAAQVKSFAK